MLGYGPISQFPQRWVRRGRWAGFTVCGVLGLAIATAWTLVLAVTLARPAWLVLVLMGTMVLGLLIIAGVDALPLADSVRCALTARSRPWWRRPARWR